MIAVPDRAAPDLRFARREVGLRVDALRWRDDYRVFRAWSDHASMFMADSRATDRVDEVIANDSLRTTSGCAVRRRGPKWPGSARPTRIVVSSVGSRPSWSARPGPGSRC